VQRTISLTLLGFETLLQNAKNIFFVAFIQKEAKSNSTWLLFYVDHFRILHPLLKNLKVKIALGFITFRLKTLAKME